MSSDVKEFALALFNRVNSLTLNPLCPKAGQLKRLLDSRDNRAIIRHLRENENSEDVADLFHFAVLHLTCNNDSDTLADVLCWGKGQPADSSVHIQWKDEEDVLFDDNPIMVASQQERHTFPQTTLPLGLILISGECSLHQAVASAWLSDPPSARREQE